MASDRWPRPTRDPRGSASARYSPRPDGGRYDSDPGAAGREDDGYLEPGYRNGGYAESRYGQPGYGDPGRGGLGYGVPGHGEPAHGEPGNGERGAGYRRSGGDGGNSDARYGEAGNGDGRYSAMAGGAGEGGAGQGGAGQGGAGQAMAGQAGTGPGSASQGGEYRQAVIRSAGADPRGPGQRHAPGWPGENGQAADRRLPYDPRDPRLADPRFPAGYGPDPRQSADLRLPADPRAGYPGHGDPRLTDPRLADPRLADPRLADPRLADPRLADPRYRADPRFAADPRMAGDPRIRGGPRPPLDPGTGLMPPGATQLAGPRRPVAPRAIEAPRLAIEAPRPAIEPPRQGGQAPAIGPAAAGEPQVFAGARSASDPLNQTDPLGSPPAELNGDPRRAGAVLPGATLPGTGLPGATLPGTGLPGTGLPGTGLPGTGPPGESLPAVSVSAQVPDPHQHRHQGSHRQPEQQQRSPDQPARGAEQQRRPGENTRAVHLPVLPPPQQQPLATPVYRTASFTFGSSAEYAAVLADATPGFSYSRIDNPTVDAFCCAVAALEGINLSYQPAAQAFASGMAAISTVFWTFTGAGARVIAPAAVYGGTYGFLRNVASRFGVQTEFVDMTDLNRVRAALRPGTAVVYAETLANPTVAVADLAGLARLAHEAGALLVVDSTLAPPVVCRPLEHGADLVLHSATKYFGGHADVTGGVVTGHPELIRKIRAARIDTGGSLGPDDSYLLRRGLETLPLRVRRQCATALLLAAGLARHPAVRTVYYPGLTAHPGHSLARRQFDAGPEGTRFGAIVTVAPYGGAEAGMAFADRLRLARLATSLGGTYTKVSHVRSTTHRQMDAAALAAAGIDEASVRFSVGLEDGEDLLADAMTALDSLGRR